MNLVSFPRHVYTLACVLAISLLALSMIQLPQPPADISLDESWTAALDYFGVRHFQFGTQVAYTYGPLGFLTGSNYSGGNLNILVMGRVAYGVISACILGYIGWAARSYLLLALLSIEMMFCGAYGQDSMFLAGSATLACFCVRQPASAPMLCATALLLSFAALNKFTYFAEASFIAAAVMLFLLLTRQRRRALLFAAVGCLSLCIFWSGIGHQNIAHFPLFVLRSFLIAAGDSGAMGGGAGPASAMQRLGAFDLALLLVLIVIQTRAAASQSIGQIRAAMLMVAAFIAWKEAFTRSDDSHNLTFFVACLILSAACLALVRSSISTTDRPSRGLKSYTIAAWAAVAGVSLLSGFALHAIADRGFPAMFSPWRVIGLWQSNLRIAGHYAGYASFEKDQLAVIRKTFSLPKLADDIKGESVDMFGDEQGLIILNGWNYRPRPIFQSFAAFTKPLMDINRNYILSDDAPRYYIMRLLPLDQRSPLEADSEAFEAILQRYEPIDAEGGYMLFRQRDEYRRDVLATGTLSFGESVTIPARTANTMDWLTLDIQPTLLGRIRAVFLHAPPILLRSTSRMYGASGFRLIPSMAAAGIPINPPISGVWDVSTLLDGNPMDDARQVSLIIDPGDASDFRASVPYTLVRRGLPPAAGSDAAYAASLTPLGAKAERIEASFPPAIFHLDGEDVMFVHAPSAVTLKIPPGARNISGDLGVLPGAFSPASRTRSVSFKIVVPNGTAETVLLERQMTNSGRLHFETVLPAAGGDKLILRADCSPNCDSGWSYWHVARLSP